jgi:Restriction endonuclease BglII
MKAVEDLSEVVQSNFEIFDWRNAIAILGSVHSVGFGEVLHVLSTFQLRHSALVEGGGNKSSMSKFIDDALGSTGWIKKRFDTEIMVDGVKRPSPTHEIDCFKDRIALEMEWNNKDPFFDRDLNNFRLLYDLHVIDVGIIVTRATSLQATLARAGRAKTTFGMATTHTEKLYPKIRGGGAGGCPVLVFGIKAESYQDDR